MTASETIKRIRKELNITQEDLARNVHTTAQTVNRWENIKTIPTRMARGLLADFCKDQGIGQSIIDNIKKIR